MCALKLTNCTILGMTCVLLADVRKYHPLLRWINERVIHLKRLSAIITSTSGCRSHVICENLNLLTFYLFIQTKTSPMQRFVLFEEKINRDFLQPK